MAAQKKPTGKAAATEIDDLLASLDDWRGELLARIRRLILDSVDGVEETWKWMGRPVWEKDGVIARPIIFHRGTRSSREKHP